MTATAFYRLARIAGGFKLSLSVHIIKTLGIKRTEGFHELVYLAHEWRTL